MVTVARELYGRTARLYLAVKERWKCVCFFCFECTCRNVHNVLMPPYVTGLTPAQSYIDAIHHHVLFRGKAGLSSLLVRS